MSKVSEFTDRFGPWALVTGASSGIGEQFARQLARRGLNVMIVARRADLLTKLAGELTRKRGPTVETIVNATWNRGFQIAAEDQPLPPLPAADPLPPGWDYPGHFRKAAADHARRAQAAAAAGAASTCRQLMRTARKVSRSSLPSNARICLGLRR